ncbi:DUF1566 domain-containing protein [Desulfobotulus mexicanus]|uniref:DUF1566 domain-containing protein n=1 Tax=Desulfobotulus mexicanus TaxID=2586642 RepID=A0A5Q4VGK0_9BACT|nr:DUF1566 domain-containing protein [Desulfobotulus mexicanus]TYT75487.1 DUF1566 domain-containing protein [Desulfobotulus mexicanus]
MGKMWISPLKSGAIVFMLCLTWLIMSGDVYASRFLDNGNGTVTDLQTNMMWTSQPIPVGEVGWNRAVSASQSFSISGIGGWRLPEKDELVIFSRALREEPFPSVAWPTCWSGTQDTEVKDNAFYVYMKFSTVYSASMWSSRHCVWPVRASQ